MRVSEETGSMEGAFLLEKLGEFAKDSLETVKNIEKTLTQ